MIGSQSCFMRATAPLRGASWCTTTRTTPGKVPAATLFGAAGVEATATAGTTPTAAGVGTFSAARTTATGTAVKTAAVRAATTVEFAAAGMAMPTTI
jgi:hypothetical protein